jgi:transcriptional regulator with XRE-family HTH domain
MANPDRQVVQQKLMGVLLRHARLTAGRSQAELAAALRVSRNRIAEYERGQRDLTIDQLRVIADLCGIPLGYFFDDRAVVQDEATELPSPTRPRVERKMVGILLRQARQCAGKSQADCAEAMGIPARRLSQYENGEREAPLAELEALAKYLDVPVSHFSIHAETPVTPRNVMSTG